MSPKEKDMDEVVSTPKTSTIKKKSECILDEILLSVTKAEFGTKNRSKLINLLETLREVL